MKNLFEGSGDDSRFCVAVYHSLKQHMSEHKWTVPATRKRKRSNADDDEVGDDDPLFPPDEIVIPDDEELGL